MTREYCVVLGDVIDSREISDRNEFKNKLEGAISSVNYQYESELHAPFRILKGVDEIGGVLRSVSPVPDIQKMISRALHPDAARIVAVVGEIDVNGQSEDVSQMDGMAFSRADIALSELEDSEFTFRLSGKKKQVDELVSDEINLLDIIRSGWSERRMEVISKYDRLGSQKEVANELGISVQGVSKHLRQPDVNRVLEIEQRLSDNLESYPSLVTNE
jgi:hypothetical protein